MSLIFKCRLFRDFTLQEINNFFRKFDTITVNYSKGDILFERGDQCKSVGIVVSGSIDVQDLLLDGSTIMHSKLIAGHTFGENIIFAKQNIYRAKYVAASDIEVMFIEREELTRALGAYKKFLVNFLTIIGNNSNDLNNRLLILSQPSLRSKIASYIFSVSNSEDKVPIGMTKEKLAKLLNVQRPSLSRELIMMKEDGLIECDRNYFYILNREKLNKL